MTWDEILRKAAKRLALAGLLLVALWVIQVVWW